MSANRVDIAWNEARSRVNVRMSDKTEEFAEILFKCGYLHCLAERLNARTAFADAFPFLVIGFLFGFGLRGFL